MCISDKDSVPRTSSDGAEPVFCLCSPCVLLRDERRPLASMGTAVMTKNTVLHFPIMLSYHFLSPPKESIRGREEIERLRLTFDVGGRSILLLIYGRLLSRLPSWGDPASNIFTHNLKRFASHSG